MEIRIKNKTPKELTDYWDNRAPKGVCYRGEVFYTTTPLPLYIKRRNWLLSKTEEEIKKIYTSGGRLMVLDFGCGDGFYSVWLTQKFPDLQVFGCDLSHKMIESAVNRANIKQCKINFKVADSAIPFDTKFDVILVFAVLAHIMDDNILDSVIKDLNHRLKPQGRLLVFEQTASKARYGKTWFRRSEKDYESKFNKVGLSIKSKFTIEYPFFWIVHNPVKGVLGIIINKILRMYKKEKNYNFNQVNIYLLICEILMKLSPIFDGKLVKQKNNMSNTLFILTHESSNNSKNIVNSYE